MPSDRRLPCSVIEAPALWKTTSNGTTFGNLAVYDSPVVIADRAEIEQVVTRERGLPATPTPD